MIGFTKPKPIPGEGEMEMHSETIRLLNAQISKAKKKIAEGQEEERVLSRLLAEISDSRSEPQSIQTTTPRARLRRKGKGSHTGLRETILSVVGSSRNGLKREEIFEAVESRGFKASGKTPLRQVISSELWRLKDAGLISMGGDNLYRTAEGGTS
ncbi:MAG: hypothetical protein HUU16_08990 [Candidatus Omnitrophica bacterium]|nr:hypothetical protein [Candidatus Omnitrophota bacterium]